MSSLYTSEKVLALGVKGRVLCFAAILTGCFAASVSIAQPASLPSPGSVEEAMQGLVADGLAANLELDQAGAGALTGV